MSKKKKEHRAKVAKRNEQIKIRRNSFIKHVNKLRNSQSELNINDIISDEKKPLSEFGSILNDNLNKQFAI